MILITFLRFDHSWAMVVDNFDLVKTVKTDSVLYVTELY